MKHWVIIGLTLSLQSCSIFGGRKTLCDNKVILTKKVTFQSHNDETILYPEFINKINRKHSLNFVIRKPNIEKSELTTDYQNNSTSLHWALEKALIEENHTVVDPSIYDQWKLKNPDRSPTFDYILEIMEAYSKAYPIGVRNKTLYGTELTIKIINPVTAQTVGILKKSITPCTSGCEFKFTECEFIEEKVLPKKKGYPQNFLSQGFSINDITELVVEMRKKK